MPGDLGEVLSIAGNQGGADISGAEGNEHIKGESPPEEQATKALEN